MFWLIRYIKSFKLKLLLNCVIFLSILDILIIQSRASYLALVLIFIAYFLHTLFSRENKIIHSLKRIGYSVIPLFFSVLVNQIYFAEKGADALSRASTISFSTNDGSVNQRLRYYEDVLTHFSSNPIFGVGFGNWKFKSIDYDKKIIFITISCTQ